MKALLTFFGNKESSNDKEEKNKAYFVELSHGTMEALAPCID